MRNPLTQKRTGQSIYKAWDAHLKETLSFDFTAKFAQMVRSPTWIRRENTKSQFIWFVVAFCFLHSIRGLTPVYGQSIQPQPFLVRSSIPYQLPSQNEPAAHPLSAFQVGKLASERCGPAKLIASEAKSRPTHSLSVFKDGDCENEIIRAFQAAVAFRLRQTASANAMKLHYGIAACLKAESVFDQTLETLQRHGKAQNQLVDKGIPIPDPTLVERLKTSLEDKRLENQSKLAVLRSQLSGLIGTENACGHAPLEIDEIVPSDRNICEHIDQALGCRCDLMVLKRLGGTVNDDTLDAWDSIGSSLAGIPFVAIKKPFLSKVLRPHRRRSEMEFAIKARRNWLDDFVSERSKQIAMEVDVAFEKKRTAALRWVNASEQFANWGNRITQLESLSEVQGNMASQFEAHLSQFQIVGQRIERWTDWHLANMDLMLAIGCEL